MEKMKTDHEEIGRNIGKLVAEKNVQYGDSFNHSGEIMKLLYPNGIPPEKYTVVLALVRILDKIFRLATNPNYNNENCWSDIAGYCILMLGYERENTLVEYTKNDLQIIRSGIHDALKDMAKVNPIGNSQWEHISSPDDPRPTFEERVESWNTVENPPPMTVQDVLSTPNYWFKAMALKTDEGIENAIKPVVESVKEKVEAFKNLPCHHFSPALKDAGIA